MFDPPAKYPVPMIYNLFTDPREEKPTPDSWVVGPVLKVVGDFDKSVKEHPLIPMGTPDPDRPCRRFNPLRSTRPRKRHLSPTPPEASPD